MRALDRKLLRDVWRLKGQGLTIALVVGCGIATFVASVTTYRSLLASRDGFYAASRFADVFASVQRAPLPVLDRVRALEGVSEAEGRVVEEARVEVPGVPEPVRGRFVSIDVSRPGGLNALVLRRGRLPERGRPGEVVVGEAFAVARGVRPGDVLYGLFEGRRVRLEVTGVGLSPEYVWVIRPGDFLPDDAGYGVFWMERSALATATGMQGVFNDLAVALSPGTAPESAVAAIDRLLEPYGSSGAYGREKQFSNRLLSQELDQLRSSATLLPLVILGVAAFLLNVLLSRTVATQREQIAALKALGYSNAQLGWHYTLFALCIVVAGALLGTGLGAWAGRGFISLYAGFFRLPVLGYSLDLGSVAAGVAVSATAGLAGALASVRRAVRLPAAEAMRPEPPQYSGPTLLERIGLWRAIPAAARMVVRDLERQPLRTFLSAAGIALATAILVVGNLSFDSVGWLMEVQWEEADRADLTVTFVRGLPERARREVAHLPGVSRAERLRQVPVRLRAGARGRETALLGVDPDWTLRRVLDTRGRPVELPGAGISLSRALGDLLGVRPGDTVEVEVLEEARPRFDLRVSSLVDDAVGTSAYMPLAELDDLLGGVPLNTGALVSVDRQALEGVRRRLVQRPLVAGITMRTHARAMFEEQIASIFLTYQLVLALFAGAIAVGVVYNNARIALALRARDLATLRILGFTRAEVGAVLVGEQVVQLAAGVLGGLPLGQLLGKALFSAMDPELYRLQVVASAHTRAVAVTVVLLAGLASALWVRRGADRLDLVSVLKARD